MYASLIAAGASQLSDLYDSLSSRKTAAPSSTDPAQAGSSVGGTGSAGGDAGTGPVNGTGASGSNFSDAIQKLFTDLQASASGTSSTSTDATSTVASDLKSVFGAAKGHHGHHPPGPPPGDASSGTTNGSSDPFQSLASSLVAYAKTASASASSTSTSLTA